MALRPAEGLCPVCGTTFPYIYRAQGGGTRKKFCSIRCRAKDWARGNGGSRRAAVTRYDNKPESKQKKFERNRKTTLAKYGWTWQDFQTQLARQQGSCYGCLAPINEKSARIDHDHATGKVRGLLCNGCNWVLGHAKDDPATLRRLMAHLERDISKTLVYLAGALGNPRVPEVGNALRAEGYDAMDEWFTPGQFADQHWQNYEKLRGRTYTEALAGRAAQNIYLFDRAYLDLCDAFVLVAPAGKSAMVELGYAKGCGKPTIVFLDGKDPDRYDVMAAAADAICFDLDSLLAEMRARFS